MATCAVAVSCASAQPERTAARLKPVLSGLSAPVLVTAPRSEPGRLYVVEQGGLVRLAVNGKLRSTPFLDVRRKIVSGGEQGLLGLAFHPRYASNHRFYVDYTDTSGDTRVVEYRSNAAGTAAIPSSARQLLFVDQPYANHNGGNLVFGPNGKLMVGMGDGGSGGDPENRAQNMRTLLGKILTIDVDSARPRVAVFSDGMRNPWRFTFDRANGDLYVGDVGQNSIEEVDYVKHGTTGLLNFGWPLFEGGSHFKDATQGPGKLVTPVATYSHDEGCSITGGYVYRGKAVPAFLGRYVYGDFCSGTIWSLEIVNGKATGIRKEPFTVKNLTSFGEDAVGELYAVSQDGTISRLAA